MLANSIVEEQVSFLFVWKRSVLELIVGIEKKIGEGYFLLYIMLGLLDAKQMQENPNT